MLSTNINWLVTTERGELPYKKKWTTFPPKMRRLDKSKAIIGDVGEIFVLYEHEEDGERVENFIFQFIEAAFWRIEVSKFRLPAQKVALAKEIAGESVIEKIAEETANDEAPPIILYFGGRGKQVEGQLELLQVLHGVRIMWLDRQHSLYLAREDKHADMLQYFVRKFNVSMGGVNNVDEPKKLWRAGWTDPLEDNLLIIGYTVAHPYDQTAKPIPTEMRNETPTVVAISANFTENPSRFIGDFDFQPAWQEQVSEAILIKRIKWILEKRRASAGRLPEHIVVIRDGFPSSVFRDDHELRYEVTVMQRACSEFQPDYQPKLAVLRVSTDEPMKLIYNNVHVDYQDEDLARKAPSLVERLSFYGQLNGFLISTPKPLHVAYHLARRAGIMFAIYRDSGSVLPRVTTEGPSEESTVPAGTIDWEKLSEILSFKGKKLESLPRQTW